MCRRTYRDSTCDRPGAVDSRLRLPSPRHQTTSVSTTPSSEHQSRLLNVIIPRGWMPIYSIPKDSNIGIDQSSVPTVFASGVSPDSIPWSTAADIIWDIVREGPFDAGATPMETEDSPLIRFPLRYLGCTLEWSLVIGARLCWGGG